MDEDLRKYIAMASPEGGSVHQENNYAELLQPKLNKVFYETYDEVAPQFNKVYDVKTSKKNKEFDFYMGSMSNWSRFGDGSSSVYGGVGSENMPSINYQTVPKGSEITYTHEEFADGFAIERKFIDDEQYGVIEKMTKDLARAGRSKVEMDSAEFMEAHLKGELTGYDGVPLFGDHTALNGTYTYNNKITDTLSPEGLKKAISMMRRVKDEAGKTILFTPDTLIVSPELEFTAKEILNSTQLAGGDLNNVNSLRNSVKPFVWDYLTDSTSWFLVDSKRSELIFYWRVKPEFEKEKDFDTKVHKWSGYMRYSYGYSSVRGIIGSTGKGGA